MACNTCQTIRRAVNAATRTVVGRAYFEVLPYVAPQATANPRQQATGWPAKKT